MLFQFRVEAFYNMSEAGVGAKNDSFMVKKI